MNTKVELRILRSFSSGQEEIMDDQENDTHSEVAKEDWPHPWSKDEAKKNEAICFNYGDTPAGDFTSYFCVNLCWHSNLRWSEGISSILYFGARLR